jgi:hypothetical protein
MESQASNIDFFGELKFSVVAAVGGNFEFLLL